MKNEQMTTFCRFWFRTTHQRLPFILILLFIYFMRDITSLQNGSQIIAGTFVTLVVLVGYLNVLALLGYSGYNSHSSISLTYIMLPLKRKERILYWDIGILVHFILMVMIELVFINLVGLKLSIMSSCLFGLSLVLSYLVACIIHRLNSSKFETSWYYLYLLLGLTHGLTFQFSKILYLQIFMCGLGAVAILWFSWLEKGKRVNKERGSYTYGKFLDQTLGLYSMSSMYKDDKLQKKDNIKIFLVIILISMFTGNILGKWSELKLFFPLNVFLTYTSVIIFLGNNRVSKIIPVPLSVSLRSLTFVVLAQGLFCYSIAFLLNLLHPVIGITSFVASISLAQWGNAFIHISVIQLLILGTCLFLIGIDGRFLRDVMEVVSMFIVMFILSSNKLDIVDILFSKPNEMTVCFVLAALIFGVIGILQTRRGCRVPS